VKRVIETGKSPGKSPNYLPGQVFQDCRLGGELVARQLAVADAFGTRAAPSSSWRRAASRYDFARFGNGAPAFSPRSGRA